MNTKTHKIVLIGLFAALTAIGGFLRIPVPPVPFTLQLFFVILSGLLLSPKAALASQAVYMAVGLSGIPIFTDGGGPGYVVNFKFGYLIGFAAAAFTISLLTHSGTSAKLSYTRFFAASSAGLLVCYSFAVAIYVFNIKLRKQSPYVI